MWENNLIKTDLISYFDFNKKYKRWFFHCNLRYLFFLQNLKKSTSNSYKNNINYSYQKQNIKSGFKSYCQFISLLLSKNGSTAEQLEVSCISYKHNNPQHRMQKSFWRVNSQRKALLLLFFEGILGWCEDLLLPTQLWEPGSILRHPENILGWKTRINSSKTPEWWIHNWRGVAAIRLLGRFLAKLWQLQKLWWHEVYTRTAKRAFLALYHTF